MAELKELITANDCDLAVFDNELSPSQMRVLEEELGVRVLDRSGLILDIFAQRAQTREGQLQVELAQYQYLLPRLTGMWTHLVRQTASGGSSPIGTRGPGETQLETDRRPHSPQDPETAGRARGRAQDPPHAAPPPREKRSAGRGPRRLHERRQIHAAQLPDGVGHSGQRPPVRHARHHDPPLAHRRRAGGAALGHGWLHPQAADAPGRGSSRPRSRS